MVDIAWAKGSSHPGSEPGSLLPGSLPGNRICLNMDFSGSLPLCIYCIHVYVLYIYSYVYVLWRVGERVSELLSEGRGVSDRANQKLQKL